MCNNRVGALSFIVTNIAFGSLLPLELFIQETPLFMYVQIVIQSSCESLFCSHQNARGYFRISSYVFAKTFCDVLPMRIIPVLLYSVISYWMMGKSESYSM